MTAPEPSSAAAASFPVASREGVPFRYGDARYGMSLVAVLSGTYLLTQSGVGQWAQAIVTRQFDYLPLVIAPILIGLALLVFGAAVHPVPVGRRGAAIAIVVVATLIPLVVQPLYIGGAVPIPPIAGQFLATAFLVTLGAVASWLILRERRGVAFLFLIALVLIPLATVGLLYANLPITASTIVQQILVAVLGVGIAWAGWAVSRGGPRPAHPRP